ncbi:MAG TPA: 23S rRNA pseudouridine(1911/1915/1917) synthase RluD [Burkholderiales bacterium]|nr:23S rRNA pseudouridine(1911/1915/1917) synthase RluD [Burkholderiales bacterium]
MEAENYSLLEATIPPMFGGLRLDQALARLFPQYSRNRLQAWLKAGHILVDGAAGTAKQAVSGGERVALVPPQPPAGSSPQAQRMPLSIVHEDRDLIVIDKPAGLVVHPGAGVPDRTLMNALLAHAPGLAAVPRAGIVHRLDKDTSGLMVVAKNVSAQADLVKQLAARSVRRVYLAVVHGDPPAGGTIDAPVGRDARARTRMAVSRRGKDARTGYRVLERYRRAALLECRLETGRTHQIRVHFQHIHHPLLGDPVYRRGARQALPFPRQALHASELSLVHPRSGRAMSWRAPLPQDMQRLVDALRAER